jgi:type I restriction enzyme R subunit
MKEKADYAAYKSQTEAPMSKFKFRKSLIEEFKNELMNNVQPLLN